MLEHSTRVQQEITENNDKILLARSTIKKVKEKRIFDENSYLKEESLSNKDWKQLQFSNIDNTVRIATVFSGIGAIEHAFQRLNIKHKIVFAGDIDTKCKESYFANYDIEKDNWFSDIRDFTAVKYKNNVDFLIGGAPCQAFSMVGKRLGFEDARGTLFYEFARIIKEVKPKIFLFENVKGLLNHDNGNTWSVIYDIFKELGYDIHYRVLNAKDYGIPQNRERVFCLGFKNKTDFLFPKPIKLEYKMSDFLEDFIDSKFFLKEKGIKFVTSHKNREKCYTQINGDVALCQKKKSTI